MKLLDQQNGHLIFHVLTPRGGCFSSLAGLIIIGITLNVF
jgi:hypothetical protein